MATEVELLEALQVVAGCLGVDQQRERRRIGGDDGVVGEAALETQARHAERAVLVVAAGIDRVVTGFGDAPGQAATPRASSRLPQGQGRRLQPQRIQPVKRRRIEPPRLLPVAPRGHQIAQLRLPRQGLGGKVRAPDPRSGRSCLLYTSDAADERSSVDLGGRRIIKKKTNTAIGSRDVSSTQKHM